MVSGGEDFRNTPPHVGHLVPSKSWQERVFLMNNLVSFLMQRTVTLSFVTNGRVRIGFIDVDIM